MSNHSGSYMLNEVLSIAKEMGVSDSIGKEAFRKFALKLVKIGYNYDCNSGEILDNFGEELGICYCCLEQTDALVHGRCQKCR